MLTSRRTFVASAAVLASTVAAVSPARAADGGRLGIVGMVKPVRRPGTLEEILPYLPPGVGMIPVYVGVEEGTASEFAAVLPKYDALVALLAQQRCDVMSIEGAPIFMVAGRARETALTTAWQQRYGIPAFTAPQNQVNALRAFGARSFVGATYFPDALNATYAAYFRDAGFDVLALQGVGGVAFQKVQDIPPEAVADDIARMLARNPKADAIYMLGSGWHVSSIIEPLEARYGIPVVHPVTARAWEIQERLGLHIPIAGGGRILTQLPPLRA